VERGVLKDLLFKHLFNPIWAMANVWCRIARVCAFSPLWHARPPPWRRPAQVLLAMSCLEKGIGGFNGSNCLHHCLLKPMLCQELQMRLQRKEAQSYILVQEQMSHNAMHAAILTAKENILTNVSYRFELKSLSTHHLLIMRVHMSVTKEVQKHSIYCILH